MSFWSDLVGTAGAFFRLGFTGPRLKDNAGSLVVRNADDTADATVTASSVMVSGDSIELNSDAANSGSDYKLTLARPATGMTGNLTLTMPATAGSSGQALATDGAGNLTWVSAGDTTLADKVNTTTLAFGDTSPVAAMTLPAGAIVKQVDVIVDTPFNGGTPTASVGISGTTSKYMASTLMDLKTAGRYIATPSLPAAGADEAVIITYASSGSTAGSARFLITYVTPAP